MRSSLPATGAAVLLAAACLYSYLHPGPLEPIAAARMGPDAIGREGQYRGRVCSVENDRFVVEQLGERFYVVGDPGDMVAGDLVQVCGVWLGDRTIKAERWHATKHRSWRIWVSIHPMLLAF